MKCIRKDVLHILKVVLSKIPKFEASSRNQKCVEKRQVRYIVRLA